MFVRSHGVAHVWRVYNLAACPRGIGSQAQRIRLSLSDRLAPPLTFSLAAALDQTHARMPSLVRSPGPPPELPHVGIEKASVKNPLQFGLMNTVFPQMLTAKNATTSDSVPLIVVIIMIIPLSRPNGRVHAFFPPLSSLNSFNLETRWSAESLRLAISTFRPKP